MDFQQRIFSLLLVVFLPLSMLAGDLLGYDDFSGNAMGWSGEWIDGDNSNAFNLTTSALGLSYESAAGIVIQGGDACMMAMDTRSGSQSKFISRAIEGLDTTFYVSFLAKFSDDFFASWNYMAVGKKDNNDDSGVLLGSASKRDRLGAAFCQNGWKSKYVNTVGKRRPKAGQTYFIVGKWTCNSSGVITNIKLWINPASSESERAYYSVSTAYKPNDVMSTIDLQSYADGATCFDELRVGRTWESVVSSIVKETVVAYSGGLGTQESPYEIASEEDLLVLSNTPTDWNKHFVQTANIIFDEDESQVDWNVDGILNYIDTKGFSPIGDASKYFSGSYNGQSYRIKNLNIHNQKSYVGLFGMCNGATITGINLSKVDFTAYYYVGGLIGYCVDNCTVDNCVVSGEVNAMDYVGGLIGFISKNTDVSHSYASCNVKGDDCVGGFVGLSYLSDVSIKNSFSTGAVDGFSYVGGFAGYNIYSEIENVYSVGVVEGVLYDGGLVGYEFFGDVKNSFWDTQSSGVSRSFGGNGVDGKSTVEMKLQSTFDNWNFSEIWAIDAEYNDGYPFLADLEKAFVAVETEFIGEGDWSDELNWTNGVPDEDEKTKAIISGDCELDEDVLIDNVLVSTTGKLKVDKSSKLKTHGKLIIEADETGVGEFYVSLEALDTVMQEKFFVGGKWTFMCVADSIIADSLFVDLKLASNWSDPDADYWIAEYSQEKRALSGTGMVDIFDGSRMLVAGKGYMVWVYNDITAEYTHLVAKTQSQVETTFTDNQAILHSGWNLVGNPFTHEMTYEDFFNCPHNQAYYTGAVYVWDGEGYVTWVGTTGDELAHVIQPMEAFFIKRTNSDEDAGYFCLQEGECACEVVSSKSSSLAMNEEIDGITIGVNPSKGIFADYTYINVFTSDKSGISEALKFEKSNSYRDLVYTHTEATDLAVNSLILDGPVANVPLTISLAGEMDSIVLSYEVTGDENCSYSLIDRHTEDTVLLEKIGELKFEVEADQLIANRFELLVRRTYDVETAISTLGESTNDLISIETAKESVKVSSKIAEDLELSIYDVSGKMLRSSSLSSYGEYSSVLMTGVYVLTVHSSKGNAEFKLLVE